MNNEQLLSAISNILDQKLDQKLDHKFYEKLEPVYHRLDDLDAKFVSTNVRLDDLDAKLVSTNIRLDDADANFCSIHNRLDRIDSEVSALRVNQREMRKDLKEINSKVSETYLIALEAWGTSTENRNRLEKSKLPM